MSEAFKFLGDHPGWGTAGIIVGGGAGYAGSHYGLGLSSGISGVVAAGTGFGGLYLTDKMYYAFDDFLKAAKLAGDTGGAMGTALVGAPAAIWKGITTGDFSIPNVISGDRGGKI